MCHIVAMNLDIAVNTWEGYFSVLAEKGKTMVVDIGIVKNQIKPKADSTLRNMRKDDLIEYIRCLEHNYNVAVSFNNQQAKNIEIMLNKDCRGCASEFRRDFDYACTYCSRAYEDRYQMYGLRRTDNA